mmetsp:Transcript_120302/g.256793  ORF Transcript_120302/g.256793 Transcript_120302/m.256793 type:complete len:211 (+) Transcript_120302:172-804(+)
MPSTGLSRTRMTLRPHPGSNGDLLHSPAHNQPSNCALKAHLHLPGGGAVAEQAASALFQGPQHGDRSATAVEDSQPVSAVAAGLGSAREERGQAISGDHVHSELQGRPPPVAACDCRGEDSTKRPHCRPSWDVEGEGLRNASCTAGGDAGEGHHEGGAAVRKPGCRCWSRCRLRCQRAWLLRPSWFLLCNGWAERPVATVAHTLAQPLFF